MLIITQWVLTLFLEFAGDRGMDKGTGITELTTREIFTSFRWMNIWTSIPGTTTRPILTLYFNLGGVLGA